MLAHSGLARRVHAGSAGSVPHLCCLGVGCGTGQLHSQQPDSEWVYSSCGALPEQRQTACPPQQGTGKLAVQTGHRNKKKLGGSHRLQARVRRRYGDSITNQLRSLGASCDWSRERFTLDDGLSGASSPGAVIGRGT